MTWARGDWAVDIALSVLSTLMAWLAVERPYQVRYVIWWGDTCHIRTVHKGTRAQLDHQQTELDALLQVFATGQDLNSAMKQRAIGRLGRLLTVAVVCFASIALLFWPRA